MIVFGTLRTPDRVTEAANFYSSVLGWTVEPTPDGGLLLVEQMPIGGSADAASVYQTGPGAVAGWLPFAGVQGGQAYDQALSRVLAGGGQLVGSGTHDGLRWAEISDPFGYRFGISELPAPTQPPPA